MPTNSENVPNPPTVISQNKYLATGEVHSTNVPCYLPSIPQPLQPHIQHFFESYVGLASEEVVPHIESVRAAAWHLRPYPCIGMYTFLHIPMHSHAAVYADILSRISNGGIFLDVGTGFGQELRRLIADGALGRNMYAIDVSSELWELGYRLFKDRERLDARLIVADILSSSSSSSSSSATSDDGHLNDELRALRGNVQVIHAGSFFHLFDWGEQMTALKRLVLLTREGALMVGHQTGREPAKRNLIRGEPRFYHDEVSWRRIWDEVADATGTTWTLEVEIGGHDVLGLRQDDFVWMGPYARALNFVARRT